MTGPVVEVVATARDLRGKRVELHARARVRVCVCARVRVCVSVSVSLSVSVCVFLKQRSWEPSGGEVRDPAWPRNERNVPRNESSDVARTLQADKFLAAQALGRVRLE